MPRNSGDQNLLTTGRSFLSELETLKNDFIRYEMPESFLTNLEEKVNAFQATINEANTSSGAKISQRADLGQIIRQGMIARRVLDGVVRNKYRSNVGKLAAWTSAGHIERPPKRKAENA